MKLKKTKNKYFCTELELICIWLYEKIFILSFLTFIYEINWLCIIYYVIISLFKFNMYKKNKKTNCIQCCVNSDTLVGPVLSSPIETILAKHSWSLSLRTYGQPLCCLQAGNSLHQVFLVHTSDYKSLNVKYLYYGLCHLSGTHYHVLLKHW